MVILAAAACSSTQPDAAPAQTASLAVTARANTVVQNCWEIWYDTDDPPNGSPDATAGEHLCEDSGGDAVQPRQVPWRFSIQVSVIHAGQTTQELIASSVATGDSIPDYVSMTPYDATAVEIGPAKAPAPPVYYLNPTVSANGMPYWLSINGFDLGGSPNVLEQTPTFNFTVNAGDTIIVEVRKQPEVEAPQFLPPNLPHELTISGVLKIGGTEVHVNGTTISPDADGTGFSFSFTR